MYCPRLDHFVRLNSKGTIGRCGHMVSPAEFSSLEEMDSSEWLKKLKQQFAEGQFPPECARCQQTENANGTSIRLNSIEFDKKQDSKDYLVVGGVLDNVCNSACQTCNQHLSTKIGSLIRKDYIRINNADKFWQLPLHRVVHLDINGGEPSASKNYKYLLENLPASVKSIRINTNCSTVFGEIENILQRGIHVTITASLDGIGLIHDYVRWPIKFEDFNKNLKEYLAMGVDLNTWTTVSALNIGDLKNIFSYVKRHKLNHSWALLDQPKVLNVAYSNYLTNTADVPDELKNIVASGANNDVDLELFIKQQDQLRGIDIRNYYK